MLTHRWTIWPTLDPSSSIMMSSAFGAASASFGFGSWCSWIDRLHVRRKTNLSAS